MVFLIILVCILLGWIPLHFLLSKTRKPGESNRGRLPPGPRPLPIIGNLLSVGKKPFMSLAELSKSYGPLMMLYLGQVPTVVISSAAIAKEALGDNDLTFSDRTVFDGVRALNHHKISVPWMPVEPLWYTLRNIVTNGFFSVSTLNVSQSFRIKKVRNLISYVNERSETRTPVEIVQAVYTTTLNLVTSSFFSEGLDDQSSQFASEYLKTLQDIVDETGKKNLVDLFPFLSRFDPQGIRRRMAVHFKKMRVLVKDIIERRMQEKKSSGSSTVTDDIWDEWMQSDHDQTGEAEPSIRLLDLVMDLAAAAQDATTNAVEWVMAELIHNPEKMKKAQAEVRETIGKGNHMEEADIAQLPYLRAVVKETLRMHPTVSLSVPRKTVSDVQVSGYTVPKGAQVLVNLWAMGRDSNIWKNPNSFEPERFLGSDIELDGSHYELMPFGTGHRRCLGYPLAIRIIPLMVGSLIHEFNWELEGGARPEDMDMEERAAFTLEKAQRLRAIPIRV